MMKLRFALVTLGTRGDALPFIAIARVLNDRGHAAVLLSNEDHAQLALEQGIAFVPICAKEMPQVDCDQREFAARQLIPAAYRTVNEIGRIAALDSDLAVVSRFGTWGAFSAAEKFGLPLANVLLQPDAIWEDGNPIHPDDLILFNAFRSDFELPPMFRAGLPEPSTLKLSLFPEWFGLPESLSPCAGHCLGFPIRPTSKATLPTHVEDFIRDRGPPIVFALGTGMAEVETYRRIALSISATMERSVIFLSPNEAQTSDDSISPYFLSVDFVDHAALFPRASVVVHNGGIGVSAQAMKAGLPQVVIPLVWDQPCNAARLLSLGVSRTVFPDALSARAVEAAIREVADVEPRLLGVVSAAVAQHDAIRDAADHLERWLRANAATQLAASDIEVRT